MPSPAGQDTALVTTPLVSTGRLTADATDSSCVAGLPFGPERVIPLQYVYSTEFGGGRLWSRNTYTYVSVGDHAGLGGPLVGAAPGVLDLSATVCSSEVDPLLFPVGGTVSLNASVFILPTDAGLFGAPDVRTVQLVLPEAIDSVVSVAVVARDNVRLALDDSLCRDRLPFGPEAVAVCGAGDQAYVDYPTVDSTVRVCQPAVADTSQVTGPSISLTWRELGIVFSDCPAAMPGFAGLAAGVPGADMPELGVPSVAVGEAAVIVPGNDLYISGQHSVSAPALLVFPSAYDAAVVVSPTMQAAFIPDGIDSSQPSDQTFISNFVRQLEPERISGPESGLPSIYNKRQYLTVDPALPTNFGEHELVLRVFSVGDSFESGAHGVVLRDILVENQSPHDSSEYGYTIVSNGDVYITTLYADVSLVGAHWVRNTTQLIYPLGREHSLMTYPYPLVRSLGLYTSGLIATEFGQADIYSQQAVTYASLDSQLSTGRPLVAYRVRELSVSALDGAQVAAPQVSKPAQIWPWTIDQTEFGASVLSLDQWTRVTADALDSVGLPLVATAQFRPASSVYSMYVGEPWVSLGIRSVVPTLTDMLVFGDQRILNTAQWVISTAMTQTEFGSVDMFDGTIGALSERTHDVYGAPYLSLADIYTYVLSLNDTKLIGFPTVRDNFIRVDGIDSLDGLQPMAFIGGPFPQAIRGPASNSFLLIPAPTIVTQNQSILIQSMVGEFGDAIIGNGSIEQKPGIKAVEFGRSRVGNRVQVAQMELEPVPPLDYIPLIPDPPIGVPRIGPDRIYASGDKPIPYYPGTPSWQEIDGSSSTISKPRVSESPLRARPVDNDTYRSGSATLYTRPLFIVPPGVDSLSDIRRVGVLGAEQYIGPLTVDPWYDFGDRSSVTNLRTYVGGDSPGFGLSAGDSAQVGDPIISPLYITAYASIHAAEFGLSTAVVHSPTVSQIGYVLDTYYGVPMVAYRVRNLFVLGDDVSIVRDSAYNSYLRVHQRFFPRTIDAALGDTSDYGLALVAHGSRCR